MKLISNFLESVEGIEIWFIIALLIFFSTFILFIIRILIWPKNEMENFKKLILDDDNENKNQ